MNNDRFIIVTNFVNIIVSGLNNLITMIETIKHNGYKVIKIERLS